MLFDSHTPPKVAEILVHHIVSRHITLIEQGQQIGLRTRPNPEEGWFSPRRTTTRSKTGDGIATSLLLPNREPRKVLFSTIWYGSSICPPNDVTLNLKNH